MKVLGGFQFGQMTFELLPIDGRFKGSLGDLCMGFVMVIFGNSGNGKTETALDLADYFRSLDMGDVAWLSYEQRHGYDLQKGWKRKGLHINKAGHSSALVIDPIANRAPGVSFVEDLYNYLKKKNSPKFIFIDSIDYLKIKFDEYANFLKEAFPNKNFIFLSHAKGNMPKTTIAEKIMYDGGLAWYVHKYIAYPVKNRFGGFEPYVVFEERARDLNPDFFAKKLKQEAQTKLALDGQKAPEVEGVTPAKEGG